jgi:hypothetical protein
MRKPFRLPWSDAWIKKGTSLLKNVVRIFNKLNEFQQAYEEVKRWALPLHHVADILNPDADKSSDSVRFHLQHLLQWVEQAYTEQQDKPMVANLMSYTKGFWKGLFTCYDHPHVPRTNNDHERFFRRTKTRHRRMTGLRSWNEYILRCGELVVFVDDALQQKDLVNRLQNVKYQTFQAERQRWSSRLSERANRRRFRSNPEKFLQNVEHKYCTLIGHS